MEERDGIPEYETTPLDQAKIARGFTWDTTMDHVHLIFEEYGNGVLVQGAITAALLDAFEAGFHSAAQHKRSCHEDAEEAALELTRQYEDDFFQVTGDGFKTRLVAIRVACEAILQERERCARVVENLPWDDARVGNGNFDDTKEYAADAIRNP